MKTAYGPVDSRCHFRTGPCAGIVGHLVPGGFRRDEGLATASAMADSIAHRGPDDRGVWLDSDAGVALGHRRLSVIDLSAAGRQPMTSPTGRYVIVFNGEIYNHNELREAALRTGVEAIGWKGTSDTESFLVAIERLGVKTALAGCDRNVRVRPVGPSGKVVSTLARSPG